MNKKLLYIVYMALILCTVSTPSAADDVTILGIPAKRFTSGNVEITITPDLKEITMLNISKAGVVCQTGGFSNAPDARVCVKTMFAENPPNLISGAFTVAPTSTQLGGSIVGKNHISISAENFSLQTLTVLGTNGQTVLNFTHPLSLIKSITLAPPNITAPFNGSELHIGSVWGKFTGVPSSDAQIIHFIGYPSIKIEFNPAAIAELLSKK